jgi:hypothetical protein
MWYDKLFNVKYLPLFHHFKAIYQFPKHIIFLVKIVAIASLKDFFSTFSQWVSIPFVDIILHEILSIEWTKLNSS